MYPVFILFIGLFISGYFLPQIFSSRVAIIGSWCQALIAVGFVYAITYGEMTPLIRMLLLVSALFLAMKTVVYASGNVKLNFFQWFCFVFLWIGMEPGLLLKKRVEKIFPVKIFMTALRNIFIGFALLFLVGLLLPYAEIYYLTWLLCLVGLSMVFHFGVINLWVACWQLAGVYVLPPFRSPFKSRSLSGFWGKGWNRAFVEMTTTIIYRPLYPVLGRAKALLATFMMSGFFHEIAIAFPVSAGWGRPLAYFLLQAGFILLERKWAKNFPDSIKKYGQIYLFSVLLLPLPLLFPPEFTRLVLFAVVEMIF